MGLLASLLRLNISWIVGDKLDSVHANHCRPGNGFIAISAPAVTFVEPSGMTSAQPSPQTGERVTTLIGRIVTVLISNFRDNLCLLFACRL